MTELAQRISLDEIAASANREHDLAQRAALSAIDHAMRSGQALLVARDVVGEDAFLAWLSRNFDSTHHTAFRYMRIARYAQDLREADITTISDALAFLAGRSQLGHEVGERRLRAVELYEAGRPKREIARMLGVTQSTVQRYLNPKAAQERHTRNRRERIAAEKALEEKRQRAAARRAATAAGGEIARLYADAERMQDTIGAAAREASDPEARTELELAGEHYRKMRDCVVRALGVS